jgi:hypothetical protein
MVERLTNDELESMWKEAVVVYLEVLSRHSPGGIEKKDEMLQSR